MMIVEMGAVKIPNEYDMIYECVILKMIYVRTKNDIYKILKPIFLLLIFPEASIPTFRYGLKLLKKLLIIRI